MLSVLSQHIHSEFQPRSAKKSKILQLSTGEPASTLLSTQLRAICTHDVAVCALLCKGFLQSVSPQSFPAKTALARGAPEHGLSFEQPGSKNFRAMVPGKSLWLQTSLLEDSSTADESGRWLEIWESGKVPKQGTRPPSFAHTHLRLGKLAGIAGASTSTERHGPFCPRPDAKQSRDVQRRF